MSTYPNKDAYGNPRTAYAIRCFGWEKDDPQACGFVYLTEADYNFQMSRPDKGWKCPLCGIYPAAWQDENFEEMVDLGKVSVKEEIQSAVD